MISASVSWATRAVYAYVDGNPVSLIDPLGLQSFGGLVPSSPSVAEGLSALQAVTQASPVASLPTGASITVNSSPGVVSIGGLRVPLLVSWKIKRTDNGSQCTIGAGIGLGNNTTVRFSDTYSNSSGDTTGLGLTSSFSTPFVNGIPAGFSWNSTTFFNGAVSNSYGLATVGGTPSASYVLSYTW